MRARLLVLLAFAAVAAASPSASAGPCWPSSPPPCVNAGPCGLFIVGPCAQATLEQGYVRFYCGVIPNPPGTVCDVLLLSGVADAEVGYGIGKDPWSNGYHACLVAYPAIPRLTCLPS